MVASKKKTQQVDQVDAVADQEAQAAGDAQAGAAAPEAARDDGPAPADGEAAGNGEAVWKDRCTRLLADFDNFRKRQVREREETVKRANEALILEILPVIDHLDLALASAADPDDPFVQGVRIVDDQLHAVLAKADARPVETAGQPFTPEHCEALGETPSDTAPAGHVAVQLRKGWVLAGRLLRPAQVIVSSGPAPAGAAEPANGPAVP